jgi:hypothetical protein
VQVLTVGPPVRQAVTPGKDVGYPAGMLKYRDVQRHDRSAGGGRRIGSDGEHVVSRETSCAITVCRNSGVEL